MHLIQRRQATDVLNFFRAVRNHPAVIQLRAGRKCLIFVFYVVGYLVISMGVRLVVRSPQRRRHWHSHVVTPFMRLGCHLMGVRRHYIDAPSKRKNYLFVGNHLGFLDILILASLRPTVFVTSVEMLETPFLGLLCDFGGCLFVERRKRSRLTQEIEGVRSALKDGMSIAIYPEGTSGDGSGVLPFKKSLLTAAVASDAPIKVMVINYRRINNEPMSNRWRDSVCWYGDQTFFPSLWKLFSLESVDAEISFHDEIHLHAHEDRHEVAERARAIVEKHYDPIPF